MRTGSGFTRGEQLDWCGERLDQWESCAVRFRYMKEHFARRRSTAPGSSDLFPGNL